MIIIVYGRSNIRILKKPKKPRNLSLFIMIEYSVDEY